MASFTINEFSGVGYTAGETVPLFSGEQTDQTAITTSGTAAQSAFFAKSTFAVKVSARAGDVRIKFGANPVANANSLLLKDGQSFDYFTGGGTLRVSVIDA